MNPDAMTPTPAIRVLVVDDQSPFRQAASDVCAATDGFHLVGSASSGSEAITMAERLRPDLILLDVRMPDLNGCEAADRLRHQAPGAALVLCSASRPEDLPAGVEADGAPPYLLKEDLSPSVLRQLWTRSRIAA